MPWKHLKAAAQAIGLDDAAEAWNKKVNNTEFQALMASAAIVSMVNGEVTTTDRERLVKNARNLESLKSYKLDDIARAFNGYVQKLEVNAVIGEIELEDTISAVDDGKAALMIVASLCDIAASDDDFDNDEIVAVRQIGDMMKADPDKVDAIIERFATGDVPERVQQTKGRAKVTGQGVQAATPAPQPVPTPTPVPAPAITQTRPSAPAAPQDAPWSSGDQKATPAPASKSTEKKDPNRPW